MNPDTTVSKMLIKGIESNHTIIKVKTKNVISYITNIFKNQNIKKWKRMSIILSCNQHFFQNIYIVVFFIFHFTPCMLVLVLKLFSRQRKWCINHASRCILCKMRWVRGLMYFANMGETLTLSRDPSKSFFRPNILGYFFGYIVAPK